MKEAIIYRPYKNQTWPLVITIPGGILFFVLTGYLLTISDANAFIFAGFGIGGIWATKVAYDYSKKAVYLDEKGIRLIGGSYLEYRDIPWEELTHACYARNYRACLFLMLSSKELSQKEAKQFANRGANSSQMHMYIDGVVVIYMDILQDVTQLREFVDSHVAHVNTY